MPAGDGRRVGGLLYLPSRISCSLRLDACELDHLGPLLGFLGDQLSEVATLERKDRNARIGKPRNDLGISQTSIDFAMELLDDVGRRAPRSDEATPAARLEVRNCVVNCGNIWKLCQPCRSRHAQCAQLAGLDMFESRGDATKCD